MYGFYKLIDNAEIMMCDYLEKKCLDFPEVKLVTREESFSRETLSCNLLQIATKNVRDYFENKALFYGYTVLNTSELYYKKL